MKTITFALQKGGTGKTSISVSVAVELSRLGKKVLLIDCDPQGNATTWLNIMQCQFELADVLLDKCEIQQAIIKTNIENLSIIPTAGINGSLKEYCDNSVRLLKLERSLEPIQNDFDFCIIDTSPAFGNFERSIFRTTDEVIPVLKLDEFSKDGFQIFMHRFQDCVKNDIDKNKEIELSKIVFTSRDSRVAQHKRSLESFERIKSSIEFFLIPTDQSFPKAQEQHAPIQDTGAKTETLAEIKRLVGALNGNL